MTQRSWEIYTGGVAPGGTTMDNSKNAHRSAYNMHSGTSRPGYLEAGGIWYHNVEEVWYLYNGTTDVELGAAVPSGTTRPSSVIAGGIWYHTTEKAWYLYDGTSDYMVTIGKYPTLSVNDVTPSVKGANAFKIANTSATTITTFDDGVEGQIITLLATEAFTTIDGGLTKTGMTIPLLVGDTLEFMLSSSGWIQIGGSVGMGRYVPIDPYDEIGDWITTSITNLTDVDVSDDGVRKGAVAANIRFVFGQLFITNTWLMTRKKGASSSLITAEVPYSDSGVGIHVDEAVVQLDNDGIFQAYFAQSWTFSASNAAFCTGYYI